MGPESDIDLLVVFDPLPHGRMARVWEFEAVEQALQPELAAAAKDGVHTVLSPVFKTPAELRQGGFLFLDLTDQARTLFDRENLLQGYLSDPAARLKAMRALRIYKGGRLLLAAQAAPPAR